MVINGDLVPIHRRIGRNRLTGKCGVVRGECPDAVADKGFDSPPHHQHLNAQEAKIVFKASVDGQRLGRGRRPWG